MKTILETQKTLPIQDTEQTLQHAANSSDTGWTSIVQNVWEQTSFQPSGIPNYQNLCQN